MNYNLDRFIQDQEHSYETALAEIKNGSKRTHWMWFIFPQLASLGYSRNARYYGIKSIDEARAYLEHSVLGERLREIVGVILELEGNDPTALMGELDEKKLCSSMTLFMLAAEDGSLFKRVIDKYYGGVTDAKTEELLKV